MLTSAQLPQTPAAPIGEATTIIYALRDIESARGPLGKMEVVHKRGFAQELPTAIAREVVRNQPEDYGLNPPDGVAPVQLRARDTASDADNLIRQILASPEALTRLRDALGVSQAEEAAEAGVAPLAAAAGAAVLALGGDVLPKAGVEPFVLTSLPGVNERLARSLEDAGLGTLQALRSADQETLAAVPGLGNKMAERIVNHLAEQQAAEPRKE
jgi:DNA uptake protein ComE-like DNA-binding protein